MDLVDFGDWAQSPIPIENLNYYYYKNNLIFIENSIKNKKLIKFRKF